MIDKNELEKIAMSLEEYDLVVKRLKREPTPVELGMFSALWSEHCGYKHTRPLFHLFPTESEYVLSKIGEENAGAIDIGDGYVAVFKAESHNHPSAVEPYEGAATGVGGILRDIFAMGMRPIALLDSLRFGDLKLPRTQYLLNGVVSGISGYGNCVGVPTVGGEIFFDNSFTGNPLVNVMCVGVGKKEDLTSAKATGKDNLLILVGADTGRDGIHGATFASVDLSEDSVSDRPAVQVGNPFMEKLLMEACIELARNHQDWIVGIQDLGAAGLTSSSLEAAERGNSGIEIDTAKVPQREIGMSAYEIMLSESQERMLIIAKKEFKKEIIDHFKKWELSVSVIGKVNDTNKVIVKDNETILADAEINLMTDAPTYELKYNDDINQYPYYNPEILIIKDLEDPNASLLEMLALPNICSKKSVYQQYDHQVLNNTIVKPGFGAAVIRVPGTDKALTMTIDCNSRKVKMDPYCGSKIAVAEATRNLVAAGSKPLALTDCLNFGNPDKSEVAYQLASAVKGIAEAANILETPVISGNASLYNDTVAGSIAPTPVIGMVGLIDNINNKIVRHISNNQKLLLIGSLISQEFDTLSGSEYYFNQTNSLSGQLKIDLEFEKKIQAFVLNIFNEKMAYIASDISDGGLLVAMAEICINYGVGFDGIDLPENLRLDATYFGEKESRFIVCIEENDLEKIIHLAEKQEIPCEVLGSFINQKKNFFHFDQINLPLSSVIEAYNQIF